MKDIPGYEGLYAASEDGRIWAYGKSHYSNSGRWKDGRFLKVGLVGHGYEIVTLYRSKQSKKFLVHRLIGLTYIPNPKKLREINHKDGNRLNNRPENLEWVTSKENKKHAWNMGLYEAGRLGVGRGQSNGLAKLTEEDVREIKRLHSTGFTYAAIGRIYQVTDVSVANVIKGKTWFHIT